MSTKYSDLARQVAGKTGYNVEAVATVLDAAGDDSQNLRDTLLIVQKSHERLEARIREALDGIGGLRVGMAIRVLNDALRPISSIDPLDSHEGRLGREPVGPRLNHKRADSGDTAGGEA